jgi:hypothetical protein
MRMSLILLSIFLAAGELRTGSTTTTSATPATATSVTSGRPDSTAVTSVTHTTTFETPILETSVSLSPMTGNATVLTASPLGWRPWDCVKIGEKCSSISDNCCDGLSCMISRDTFWGGSYCT